MRIQLKKRFAKKPQGMNSPGFDIAHCSHGIMSVLEKPKEVCPAPGWQELRRGL